MCSYYQINHSNVSRSLHRHALTEINKKKNTKINNEEYKTNKIKYIENEK